MPTFKQSRAGCKRVHRRWRPGSNIAAGSRHDLAVAAEACGQVLTTVPEKPSRFMPTSEQELRFLDTFTYWTDPASLGHEERPRVDCNRLKAMQDPAIAAALGIRA